MGSTIQYRYAPYRYEDPPPMDYVYQEYAEIPCQTSQHYEYAYDPQPNQLRQSSSQQQYRARPYYSDRTTYPPRNYYTEHNIDRPSWSSRDHDIKQDAYAYNDSYARDTLVSRVVPVDGGYEYRPVPDSSQQPIDDERYRNGDFHIPRYSSPPPRPQSAYDGYSHGRYRHAQHPYKRSRPASPPGTSPRQESNVEHPSRDYQPARTYPRKRPAYTTSEDSNEKEEQGGYTILKPKYRGDGISRGRSSNSGDANAHDGASTRFKRDKVERKRTGRKETQKTLHKKQSERAKNTEIDSGQDTMSQHSEDAAQDLADNLSAATARRPQISRPSTDNWSSDENMTLNEYQLQPRGRDGKRLKLSNGKRVKKRRLLSTAALEMRQYADDHQSTDEDRPLSKRSPNESPERKASAKEEKRKKKYFQHVSPTDVPSLEEEILDGAGSDGERIPLGSISSFESDVGEKADVESEGSRRELVSLSQRAKGHRSKWHTRARPKRRFIPPCLDPKEPYPTASKDFLGVPTNAIGDLLQVWDFISSFSKTLRLTGFKLHHLQQAIVLTDRTALLDACILRLVQAIILDDGLVKELRIPSAVTKGLGSKAGKNGVALILQNLPNILDFESDEKDDHLLQTTVAKLDGSNNKLAFYKVLDPAEKLRILRELVDYATMADHLRACVTDSMDHAEEEKKKAREENSANRRKMESQLRELRTELLEYRTKNGLLENGSIADSDRGGMHSGKENGIKSESASVASDREEQLSRKEKMLVAKKERREQEERREKERGAEAILARIDKVKAGLKTLKTMRLRNKPRDGDDRLAGPGSTVGPGDVHEDPVRTYPLGTDRRQQCYWFFSGSGRLWVEDTVSGDWVSFSDMDSIHGLMKWLSPNRKAELALKRNLRQRLEVIENMMIQEKKDIEQAENEEKEAEMAPRTTRAGKRRATQVKAKKRTVATFLDYRNLER